MSVTESDIKFFSAITNTDTSANGGRKGITEIQTGVKHNLFPRVTAAERTVGLTRYRKEFWCNRQVDDDVAYNVMLFLEMPSNAGDRFYLGSGSQRSIQGDLAAYDPCWMGVGSLGTLLNGGESSVAIVMENNDFQFPNGGYLHITNKFSTGQTIDSAVSIGDSVQKTVATWYKISPTADIVYPKGLYIGGNTVMTLAGSSYEEWVELAENLYTSEVIGAGTGADASPALDTLDHKTKGVCRQPGKLPVVTATCGGVARTVNVASDGSCSGYCSAGQLNMVTGVWSTNITFITPPDNSTNITITYRENCFVYTGNTATVSLETGITVAHAYAIANTYCGGCIDAGDIEPSQDNWVETTIAGTYDEVVYPPTLFNDGTEEDTWTITFTSAVNFVCVGLYNGAMGSGSVGGNFSPTNINTGQPYFTLLSSGWGGTWVAGQTIVFQTHPAASPIWLKQVIPALCAAEPSNCIAIGSYSE